MAFSVSSMCGVEIFGLVAGFGDEDGLARPVNGGVGGLKPG